MRGRYGNAVLSRYPIVASSREHLRGGTEARLAAGTRKHNGDVAREAQAWGPVGGKGMMPEPLLLVFRPRAAGFWRRPLRDSS